MKFVKVTALAAAMAASFGANAELTALEDEALESVTGQAGITIEQTLGGLDIYYLDGDGGNLTAATGDNNGGVLKIEGLETTSITTATGAVGADATSIQMTVDVADDTATTTINGGAIVIGQSLVTAAGTSEGALKIADIKLGGTGLTAQTDAAFTAGFDDINVTTPVTGIGSVYITGLDTTMYIYAH